ncbi:hypothetical protein [Deinococcus humi]|uniref:Uncharacterized protein n=1 Tax=Deinococcus humi TaxID=662880 RepID=A0A7W8JUK6_9DEIO|nr:hypothetical protein [Deinococcus humi]MBB5363098.1 hypothetical protein [Deinococcus humi]GGO24701.1 hypothetical protein GCM10008949_13880 [Deinococcus humi]
MRPILLALLLALTACVPAPPPGVSAVYRTTEGGPALSTKLMIWTADKSELVNLITNDAPGGIEGGFKWQLSPSGNTIQLEFSGRNDRVRVPPRGVVQLVVNDDDAFYGVMPDPPPLSASEATAMHVLGGQEALRKVLMDGEVYQDQGVYDIVRDVLQRLCPPSLVYDPTVIGNGTGTDHGPTLSTFYSPTSNLVTALDTLAKTAETTWGVNASGQVFFGRPALDALTVAYSAKGWMDLPIQGREAVTRAVVRIVSAPALPNGGIARWSYGLPKTVIAVAESADHDRYRAEAAFDVPEGVSLTRPVLPTGNSSLSSFDGSPTFDDDPATTVQVALSPTARILALDAPIGRTVGAEFEYVWPSAQSTPAYRWRLYLDSIGAVAEGDLLPVSGLQTVRIILPPGTTAGPSWDGLLTIGAASVDTPTPDVPLEVSRVRFLAVDEDVAQRVAESYLQPPFAAPAEVTVGSLFVPTPDIVVTGSPLGDLTAPTTLWEYQHDDGDITTTRVRIGATGADPTVRALKFALRGP